MPSDTPTTEEVRKRHAEYVTESGGVDARIAQRNAEFDRWLSKERLRIVRLVNGMGFANATLIAERLGYELFGINYDAMELPDEEASA